MKQKTLSVFSIFLICILCLIIGILLTVIGCFCWVYNTPAIKEAFVATYNKDNDSVFVKEDIDNLLNGTVELNIPLFFLELSEEPFDYKLTEEDKENGFTKITKNSDGSATYTIKKNDYNKFLSTFKQTTKESLDEILSSGLYATIEKIEYTENFEKITITVNKTKFKNSFDNLVITACGSLSYAYQLFDVDSEKKCIVEIKDSNTNKIFQTSVFPDSFSK